LVILFPRRWITSHFSVQNLLASQGVSSKCSGCGSEYQETINKSMAMRKAIAMAEGFAKGE
jgi:hypothetical protein